MNSVNGDEWSDFYQEIKDNDRGHADYFSWESDRAIEEAGVVQCLSESLEYKGELFFHSYKSREVDPPDCDALNNKNESIGIEVTELVEGSSIAKAKQDKVVPWSPWSTEKLDETISRRISRKDNPTKINGGPYKDYILVIYCAEPAILDFNLIEHIRNTTYNETTLISQVYFLMAYSPWEKCCPYLKLKLENA
ncbi:MAG: hypothetical protein GY928_29060 [Colwellia sp.]|nr:hypothetical protein [Colwellia sp.]